MVRIGQEVRKIRPYPFLIFFSIALVAYWQLSFLANSLIWDAVDVYYPWKFHMSECLQNGYFPYWNPYQMCGFPFHANLQTTMWYPTSWIIGILFGYSIPVLQWLFILRLSLAGFGVFLLTRHLTRNEWAAYAGGIAYMLSGFFVAHGQHFTIIIAATWIPYVLFYYLKLLHEPAWSNVLKTAFFAFLMITGGYQILSVVTAYIMLSLLIIALVKSLAKNEGKRFRQLIGYNLALIPILLLLLLMLIIPTLQVFEHTSRFAEGLTYMQANETPFTPQSSISFLLPFSTVDHFEVFRTDISMSNLFFGSIMLIFFLFNLAFIFKSVRQASLLIGSIFFLLASFGKHFPLHRLLYDYVPLMDSFRAPSLLGWFALLGFILLAACGIKRFIENRSAYGKHLLIITIMILLVYLIAGIYSMLQINAAKQGLLPLGKMLGEVRFETSIFHKIFLQSTIQFFLLLGFILLAVIRKATYSKALLLSFIILEMIIAVQINIHYTAISRFSPGQIEAKLDKLATGFPIPNRARKISDPTIDVNLRPLWHNTATFKKQIDFNAFSSFRLLNYKRLDENYPELKKAILQNPPVYLSDRIFPLSLLKNSKGKEHHPKDLYIPDHKQDLYAYGNLRSSPTDSLQIIQFGPNSIKLRSYTQNGQILTLLQANYPGWEVFIDKSPVEHFTSNLLFPSVFLPPGKHTITFTYSNPFVILGFFISYGVFIILIIFLIHFYYRHKIKAYLISGSVVFLTLVLVFKFSSSVPVSIKEEKAYRQFADSIKAWNKIYGAGHISYICNIDGRHYFDEVLFPDNADNIYHQRFETPGSQREFNIRVEKLPTPYLGWITSELYNPVEQYPNMPGKYTDTIKFIKHKHTTLVLLKRNTGADPWLDFSTFMDFEQINQYWKLKKNQLIESPFNENDQVSLLDHKNQFSSTFRAKTNELNLSGKMLQIDLEVKYHFPEAPREAFLVVSIGKQFYRALPLHTQYEVNKQWNKACFTLKPPEPYEEDIPITIYVWNPGKATIFVDDIGAYFKILE